MLIHTEMKCAHLKCFLAYFFQVRLVAFTPFDVLNENKSLFCSYIYLVGKCITFCKIRFLTSSLLACSCASNVARRCSRLRSLVLAISSRSFSLSKSVCAIFVCFKCRFSFNCLSLSSRCASRSLRRSCRK